MNDRESLRKIAEVDFPKVQKALKLFVDAFHALWLKENKAFGMEVQEIRLGGLQYRMEKCRERLCAYLNNEIDKIDELEEKCLAKFDGFEGKGITYNVYRTTVTTCLL